MKTVQDYSGLGLVLASGDKLSSAVEDGWVYEKSESHLPPRYHGVVSFAWRNNDGVKPAYKGVIEVECENGNIYKGIPSDFMYWCGDGTIIKWRPVVLQSESDDLQSKLAGEIFSAMGSSGLTAKGFVNALNEAFKPKPPFWNKSIQTLNCPCVAVNIKAIKPTVSPKEDKPMKPVYTAEMHAKGELPPVGSECILIVNNEPRPAKVTYIGKDIVCCSNVDGDAEYACLLGLVSFKPIIKTIKVNGFDVPAPMSEAPEHRRMVYLAHAAHVDFNLDFTWQGDDASVSWLSRGLVHSTKSAAIAHAKAMLGIDPNA